MREIRTAIRLFLTLGFCTGAFAQGTAQTQETTTQASQPSEKSTQEKNVQEYIELLRSDIRQQKAQIMGAVMKLDVDQAANFWPIYSEHDAESTKLNNLSRANIREYARHYDDMIDAKADELIQNAMDYRKEESELLAKYHGQVKSSLVAIQAARFLEIEEQILLIIDLQIESASPIVE